MLLRLVRVTDNRALVLDLVEVLQSGISDLRCVFLSESSSERAIFASEGHWIVKRFSVRLLDTMQTIERIICERVTHSVGRRIRGHQ